MNPAELTAWLNGLSLTAPLTLDDTKALYGMIRNAVDKKTIVEVHATDHRFTHVHVMIGSIDRVIDVV